MDKTNINNDLPNRKTVRMRNHSYSDGYYFVTICCKNFVHYFGEIQNDRLHPTIIGKAVQSEIYNISSHHQGVRVINSVVMPNHIHLILYIPREETIVDRVFSSSGVKRERLSVVVASFKRAVTMYCRKKELNFKWLGRFHEHLIRNKNEFEKIYEYIKFNPLRWSEDCNNI